MMWSDYWGALSTRQRTGLIAGSLIIAILTIVLAVWLLRDPFVPLATELSSEQLKELTQTLDRAKLDYRIGLDGNAVDVPSSQLGKARAASADGQMGVPPSVGLELFKETDFSSTDFAQRINYQRALQGELTRTIQGIAGVRSARVHVILADGGVFKRNASKPSAAVSLTMRSDKVLSPTQVRGIQRLVAASVPEIKVEDVVVLDESGVSLTRAAGSSDGELSSAQLDLKRQADQYLESKLQRLLQDMAPQATASVAVDTVLDERQLRVTTDEPIAASRSKGSDRAAGVLVKERQSQRGRIAGVTATDDDDTDDNAVDREFEYSVGHRAEQIVSAPGSIKRISVAVALQGAPADLSTAVVEQFVGNAVGIDRSRGDSVAVLLSAEPKSRAATGGSERGVVSAPLIEGARHAPASSVADARYFWPFVLAAGLAALLLAAAASWWAREDKARKDSAMADSAVDIDAKAAAVREWLKEGVSDGRA